MTQAQPGPRAGQQADAAAQSEQGHHTRTLPRARTERGHQQGRIQKAAGHKGPAQTQDQGAAAAKTATPLPGPGLDTGPDPTRAAFEPQRLARLPKQYRTEHGCGHMDKSPDRAQRRRMHAEPAHRLHGRSCRRPQYGVRQQTPQLKQDQCRQIDRRTPGSVRCGRRLHDTPMADLA